MPDRKGGKRPRGRKTAAGKRRRTGAVEEQALEPRELARHTRRVTRMVATRRIVLAIVGSVVIIGGAIAASLYLNRSSSVPTTIAVAPPSEAGLSTLIGIQDSDGDLISIALVVVRADVPSRLVLVTPSLLTVLPGYGERLLADSVEIGGPELFELSITNLMGIRVDAVVLLELSDMGDVIGGPLVVDLVTPLIVKVSDGETVAVAEGSESREVTTLVRLLSDPGVGDQAELLIRQGAVWEAMLEAAASDSELRDRLMGQLSGDHAVAVQAFEVAGRELLVTAIPARRIEAVGGGLERYSIDSSEVAAFVETAMPSLRITEEPRLRLEVLNGNGEIGTTIPVAHFLVREGYRVVFTDNADRDDYGESRVYAHGIQHQEAALALQSRLGTGIVYLEQRQPSAVVDLTIIVGKDLANFQR